MTRAFHATDRAVLRLTGADRIRFLQDLVTNDVTHLDAGPVYAALLTPQGKYLADFFLATGPDGDSVLLDADAGQSAGLAQRLSMYRLRADVTIESTQLAAVQGLGSPPAGGWLDPREPALGWRLITDDPAAALSGIEPLEPAEWGATRIRLGVPSAGADLTPNDSYILEFGFDRLHGVDFRKGCYVGQEVTARMRHKTELRKGLARIALDGEAAPGTEIEADGKPAGKLLSVAGPEALAYLRFDRAEGALTAGTARVTRLDPP